MDSILYNTTNNKYYSDQLYGDVLNETIIKKRSLFGRLRLDLEGGNEIPILVGTILPNLYYTPNEGMNIRESQINVSRYVNKAQVVNLDNITEYETSKYLSLEGRNGKYQGLHYTAESERLIGLKYYEVYMKYYSDKIL